MTKGTKARGGIMLIRQKGMLRSEEMTKRTSIVKKTNEYSVVDIEEAYLSYRDPQTLTLK